MTAQTAQTAAQAGTQRNFLRTVIRANAVFSDVSGLAFILFNQRLAEFTGISSPLAFIIMGLMLFGWAAWLWFDVARTDSLDRRAVIAVITLDALWVAGSIVLLLTGVLPLTVAGKWSVAIIADIVGLFAILQVVGLRRMA